MPRTTIDYGIDLGTTNSSIAVLNGTLPEVVPNKDGSLVTPSALWYDKRGKQYVGHEARARSIDRADPENYACEFKLHMGDRGWRQALSRIGREMLPEEMSAEVLKSLKADVRANKGEDLQAAVITVPAAFELAQCDATRRAGELAGLTASPLLQEPVAVALAYGFQSASDKVFWLVYDFGGGTFDAAVIQLRDGVIQVANHAGDNHLGGKNIDRDIVEKLLVPQLTQEHPLSNFTRHNRLKWEAAFVTLKYYAEKAKIQVSRTGEPSQVWVEDLCLDDRNESVDFEFLLTPDALRSITAPWIEQSVQLCRRALEEKGLTGQDIEKVLLAGGSSQFPWLRDRLAGELGIPLEFSIDPTTVVARGAAVFAGSQRLQVAAQPMENGDYAVQLEYDPVGNSTEPLVVGRITAPSGTSLEGLRVEIVELRSEWRSGTIMIAANGVFETEVRAERGRRCEYQLILTDATGTQLSCAPDRFSYTVGMPIANPPLTHNLGVAMDGNRSDWLFKKGDPLPARCSGVYHTTVFLRRNEPYHKSDNVIRIALIEGGNLKADRNRKVTALEIKPDNAKVRRDVPMGADLEVKITIDESRTTALEAYIPILDETFRVETTFTTQMRSPEQLREELERELERLEELEDKAIESGDSRTDAALERMEREQVVEAAQRLVEAAQGDADARGEADRRILDLKIAVDSVEDALRWPSIVQEAEEQVAAAREAIDAHGSRGEKRRLERLEADVERAIKEDRVELLQTRLGDLRDLNASVVVRQPSFWVGYLQYLEEQRDRMSDRAAADRLLAQGHRAIREPQDLEALKAAVRQLIRLLPDDDPGVAEARGAFGSTIVR